MLRYTLQLVKTGFLILVLLTLLTGLVYPVLITGIGQLIFKDKSNGSMTDTGSQLMGQAFTGAKYFWGRPSATTPFANNGASSGGSNLAPGNPALVQAVQARIAALHAADPANKLPIPADLVTASASGLDPDITPAAAYYQTTRIAHARGISVNKLNQLVEVHIIGRQFGFLGEPRVNVRQLNIDLDRLRQGK